MLLEKELETYQRALPELQAQEGKFALIHDDEVVDTFGTYEDAIKEGYSLYALEPFLVKEIHAVEQVQFIAGYLSSPTRAWQVMPLQGCADF